MKKLTFCCAIMLLSGWTTWAADNFLVKIRGSITGPDGRVRVYESDLVLSGEQRLTMQIDATNHIFDLVQTDDTGTNVIRQETHAENAAVTANHRSVTFDMQENEGFSGNIANLGVFNGRLIGTGRISYVRGVAKSVRFSVIGVWNPVENSTFKGIITGKRIP
jgi:hypothetical protein